MRHDLAIVVASALLVIGSQTRVAADSGSLSQGSPDSQLQPRVQADIGTMDAVDSGPQFDLKQLAAGMTSDPAVVAKGKVKEKKKKHKDHDNDVDHRKDGDHRKDSGVHQDNNHKKDKYPGDWNPDTGNNDAGNTPTSPTPEPGTLLLTGLVAASAGLRARRARKSR